MKAGQLKNLNNLSAVGIITRHRLRDCKRNVIGLRESAMFINISVYCKPNKTPRLRNNVRWEELTPLFWTLKDFTYIIHSLHIPVVISYCSHICPVVDWQKRGCQIVPLAPPITNNHLLPQSIRRQGHLAQGHSSLLLQVPGFETANLPVIRLSHCHTLNNFIQVKWKSSHPNNYTSKSKNILGEKTTWVRRNFLNVKVIYVLKMC